MNSGSGSQLVTWIVGTALFIGVLGYAALQLSPWPAALFYRFFFNRGGEALSAALERHVPAGVAEVLDQAPVDPALAAPRRDPALRRVRPWQRKTGRPLRALHAHGDLVVWRAKGAVSHGGNVCRETGPLLSHSRALAETLTKAGVKVDTLFFRKNYRPELPHEYQFNLDTEAGRLALERTLEFLGGS